VSMGHALGLRVLAEASRREKQLARLRSQWPATMVRYSSPPAAPDALGELTE